MTGRLKSALFCATILTGVALASGAFAGAKVPPGVTLGERAQSTQSVTFDVFLPLRNKSQLDALLKAQQDRNSPQFHQWLTPAQFGQQFGPDAATMQRAADFLRKQGFSVTAQTQSLYVTGNVGQVTKTFGVTLNVARTHEGHSLLVQSAMPVMPNALASMGAHIVGFTPHMKHVFAVKPQQPLSGGSPESRLGPDGPYWYNDMKQAYQYPANDATVTVSQHTQLNGTGARIGVLISSDVLDSDINEVFNHEHWTATTGLPNPQLFLRRYIDGAVRGQFSVNSNDSFEASLDVQQELGGAPGARVYLYDIPDLSDGHVIDGYNAIVQENAVDLVSSSFGLCELFYEAQYNGGQDFTFLLGIYEGIFQQGNAQGITFLASSGDFAGVECLSTDFTTFIPGVSHPAADPFVTAVGGTNLVTTFTPPRNTNFNSAYVTENAWEDPLIPFDPFGVGVNATGGFWGAGGGYSTIFAKPAYQTLVPTGSDTQRSLPDIGMQVGGCPAGIAADFNPKTGLCNGGNKRFNGSGNTDRSAAIESFGFGLPGGGLFGVIGTSVSSPELAGALANLIATQGRQGNLNPYIYGLAASQASGGPTVYHTNIPGFNGVQNSLLNSEYSLSVGVGTPIVAPFIGQAGEPQAGLPRTPSNP